MSKAVVGTLENWKELLKTPRTSQERCGIGRHTLIEKAFRDVAEFELRDGKNTIEVIHEMINEYIPIDLEDDNEYVIEVMKVGQTKYGKDPFLKETLGRRMFNWVKYESGLMDYMPFRILLACQTEVYFEMINEDSKWENPALGSMDGVIAEFKYDRLKDVVFNEHYIMGNLILPMFIRFREEMRTILLERE